MADDRLLITREQRYKMLFVLERMGPRIRTFAPYPEYMHRIGTPSKNGEIWRARIPILDNDAIANPCIAIKKIPMKMIDNRVWKRALPPERYLRMRRNVFMELYYVKECSRLVREHVCPGFLLVFFHAVEEQALFENARLHRWNGANALLTMMELADGDLKTWAHGSQHTDNEWWSAIFQIVFAVIAFQTHVEITHNDLHWGNILTVRTTPTPWIRYHFKGMKYTIPFAGVFFVISDFGFATKSERRFGMKDLKRIANLGKWLGSVPRALDIFHRIVSQSHSSMDVLEGLRPYLPQHYPDHVSDEFRIG